MLLHNANLKGFFTGKIYGGPLKSVCVPGLNCYSCPGAVGACPIGSLQSFLGALRFRFPYYVIGMLIFFGALLGRTVCGFLCPFGWLQELLNAVPLLRKTDRFALDKPLRCLKYVVLALLLTMPGFAFAADESSDAKKLSLSGHAEGFGDADLWISGTALDAVANITEDDMLLLRVDGVVRGEPVNAVLGIKEDGVYLAFPDAMEEKYFVSMDTLTDVFGDKADDYGVHITAGKVDVGEVLSDLEMEKLTESLGKYFSIIAGFVKEENTVTVSGDYELAGLGEMVTGEYVIFTPTKEDWSNLIKDLLTTLQSDEEMMQLLEKGITVTAKEEGTSPEETMQTIRDLIASGIENADTYAKFLSSLRFTLVKTGNGSIACVKAEMPDMFGVGYEGFGSIEDTRRDAIVMYDLSGAEVLALNTLTMSENGIMGKLTVDMLDAEVRYAVGDGSPYFSLYAGMGEEIGAQLTVADAETGVLAEAVYNSFDAETEEEQLAVIDLLVTDTDEQVELPDGDWTELKTEEEIKEAAQAVHDAVFANAAA